MTFPEACAQSNESDYVLETGPVRRASIAHPTFARVINKSAPPPVYSGRTAGHKPGIARKSDFCSDE
jgi:hypothetical protein